MRKLLDYGLITRTEKPGRVRQVNYGLTPMGRKLNVILEQLRDLDEEHAQTGPTAWRKPSPARLKRS